MIKKPTKRWLVMAGKSDTEVVAEYDDAASAYKKADEKKEYCVWLLESWLKKNTEDAPPSPKKRLGA